VRDESDDVREVAEAPLEGDDTRGEALADPSSRSRARVEELEDDGRPAVSWADVRLSERAAAEEHSRA